MRRMKDLEMVREQDEIEFAPPKIFNDRIDKEKFNALFESKYGMQLQNDQLVKQGAPSAFNDVPGSSFISCEGNYDDIYDEGESVTGTNFYGTTNDIGKEIRVTKEDLEKIKNIKSGYSTHNIISKEYSSEIEKKLREREIDDNLFDARKMNDYNTDNTMGGYGFLHQVGLTGREMEWDKEDIDENVAQKLLLFRQIEDRNLSRGRTRK